MLLLILNIGYCLIACMVCLHENISCILSSGLMRVCNLVLKILSHFLTTRPKHLYAVKVCMYGNQDT